MNFDCLILGAGPGGYVSAIRASQLGMKTAIVEKRNTFGGTCLNVGCIPSKALLDSSEHYYNADNHFDEHGIKTGNLSIDLKQMMARKSQVVEQTTKGIDYLVKKNKITSFTGTATFVDNHTVNIKSDKGSEQITAKNIIIATGSEPTPLPNLPFDGEHIISSTEALSLTKIPKEMVVIGGGVIGVELGSVYARLGTRVTVIEFFDRLIPTMDKELGKELEKSLKKLGMVFHFQTKVVDIKTPPNSKGKSNEKSTVIAHDNQGKELKINTEKVLVAIGRKAYTSGLGLDKIGITLDKQGKIPTDENYATSVSGVYAIGDVIAGPMLAHKASEEGVICIEKIAGHHANLNYRSICGVVYTWPEVASTGDTEEILKEKNIAYNKGIFPFKASGRARAANETAGFVKILTDKTNDEILGIHMIGPRVADLISEGMLALEYKASAEDLAILPYPHPTFSEAIKEAALMATGNRAIHV